MYKYDYVEIICIYVRTNSYITYIYRSPVGSAFQQDPD